MQTLEFEWRHLASEGNTCTRCAETGKTIFETLEDLKKKCLSSEAEIIFKETLLDEDRIGESNTLLFNGKPLEDLLEGIRISDNYCDSCTQLTGKKSYCRTVETKGETYEAIPESIIREAFCKVIHCESTHCMV